VRAHCLALTKSAVASVPNDTDALNSRAAIHGVKGQYERALQDSDSAIRLNPNLAEAYYNRVLALRALGRSFAGTHCGAAVSRSMTYFLLQLRRKDLAEWPGRDPEWRVRIDP
jgi:tetratricopeptide (TPR) repeat protein